MRPFRWLLSGLLYSLADRLMPPLPDEAASLERIRVGVMDEVAADHGRSMAMRQLAAAEIAKHMAARADVGGRRESPVVGWHGND